MTHCPAWVHLHQLGIKIAYAQHENGSTDVLFKLIMGLGMHWLKYSNVWMQVHAHISFPIPFYPTIHLPPLLLHLLIFFVFVFFLRGGALKAK
jgi:hypothetical protein